MRDRLQGAAERLKEAREGLKNANEALDILEEAGEDVTEQRIELQRAGERAERFLTAFQRRGLLESEERGQGGGRTRTRTT